MGEGRDREATSGLVGTGKWQSNPHPRRAPGGAFEPCPAQDDGQDHATRESESKIERDRTLRTVVERLGKVLVLSASRAGHSGIRWSLEPGGTHHDRTCHCRCASFSREPGRRTRGLSFQGFRSWGAQEFAHRKSQLFSQLLKAVEPFATEVNMLFSKDRL